MTKQQLIDKITDEVEVIKRGIAGRWYDDKEETHEMIVRRNTLKYCLKLIKELD